MDKNNHFSSPEGISLKEYINDRFVALEKSIDARFESVITATNNALGAADKAVSKAESASEKRFEGVNEFRASLADQQRTLMPRAEVEILTKNINEKIDLLISGQTKTESKGIGSKEMLAYVVGIIGIVSAIVTLLTK